MKAYLGPYLCIWLYFDFIVICCFFKCETYRGECFVNRHGHGVRQHAPGSCFFDGRVGFAGYGHRCMRARVGVSEWVWWVWNIFR